MGGGLINKSVLGIHYFFHFDVGKVPIRYETFLLTAKESHRPFSKLFSVQNFNDDIPFDLLLSPWYQPVTMWGGG